MHAYFFALDSNIFRKKISGNHLNSGTGCHSCFFKEHFFTLDLTSSPPFQCLLWSQKIRTKEKVHFCALCFTLFSSVSTLAGISRWAAAQEEGCCDFVALAEVLSERFTDDLTAPVPPHSVTTNTKQLYMRIQLWHARTPHLLRNKIHKRG